jgi:hypothetical protein
MTTRRAQHQEDALQLVLARVRLRARRRSAWLRKLWGEEVAPGGGIEIAHAEIDTHLDDRDSPAAEAEWLARAKEVVDDGRELRRVERRLDDDRASRLARLEKTFALEGPDRDVLHACLAVALDPSLGRVYGYVQDHAGRPFVTEALTGRLFGHGRATRLRGDSPLAAWALVERLRGAPGEPDALVIDPYVRRWLEGEETIDDALLEVAAVQPEREPLEGWPFDEAAHAVERALADDGPAEVRLRVVGAPRSGRATLAAASCAEHGLRLLVVDADRIDDHRWPSLFLRAQRHAKLDGCALAWRGESLERRRWPQSPQRFPLQVTIEEPGAPPVPDGEAEEHRVEMPAPSLAERRELWHRLVPGARRWRAAEMADLVSQHVATVGDVAAVARRGPTNPEEAAQRLRESRRHRLGGLVQLVPSPFGWDDLVVPPPLREALEDVVYEARERAAFWERPEARRMFPQGRGLLGLFSGSPGTGKTMAAQVIAGSLGRDLMRVDLSAVVSKYVGESSQRVQKVLTRAEGMDVVVFFDECDALFAKRTKVEDAQARFANTDTAHLLQAIESYTGVCLLATNKRANVDPAFVRRLRFVLEFPLPDAERRLEIWRKVVTALAGEDTVERLDVDLARLAEGLDSTGAQIKLAVLTGLFAARRDGEELKATHLVRGVERELMKEGRGLAPRDRELVLANAA